MIPVPESERDWSPRPPAPALLNGPRFGAGWRLYLEGLGYAAGELGRLVDGVEGQHLAPGLTEAVGLRLAELDRLAGERGEDITGEARRRAKWGAAREYLIARPPAAVLLMVRGPAELLSPGQLGARLQDAGERGIWLDAVTGTRWRAWRYPVKEHAAHAVIAGALYRLAGVVAPSLRLARLGSLAAVAPEPRSWERQAPADAASRHGEELGGQLAADAWIGNRAIPAGLRFRRHRLGAGFAGVLRWELGGCLGYQARGQRDPGWARVGGVTADLRRFTRAPKSSPVGVLYGAAVADLTITAPTARKIARLSRTAIAGAVAAGGLPDVAATALVAVLEARRGVLLAQLQQLGAVTPPATE